MHKAKDVELLSGCRSGTMSEAVSSPSSMQKQEQVVAYWFAEKKCKKLNLQELESTCRNYGFRLQRLDLNIPLDAQGHFDILLHKLTDIIVKASQGDPESQDIVNCLEKYRKNHPEVIVIDPLDNVRKLLDRNRTYSIIDNSDLGKVDGVFTPAFVELTSSDVQENLNKIKAAGVSFPFVCKPAVAHGSKSAHKMALILNEAGMKDCRPPCVAQTFINHNAVLYKVFVVGNEHFMVERPSLKNFSETDGPTIFFDSHDVSKPDSSSSLSILDPEDRDKKVPEPDPEEFRKIVTTLGQELGMALFGVDVVIENGTGKYAIIDVNAYPGYDGYPNFNESLARYIALRITSSQTSDASGDFDVLSEDLGIGEGPTRSRSDSECQRDQDDSGIDTSDSSDEKKKKQEEQQKLTKVIPSSRKCSALVASCVTNACSSSVADKNEHRKIPLKLRK